MGEATARLHALVGSTPTSDLAAAFAAAGHELALVGGPVRDAFLDRPVTDLDYTTSAGPDEILRLVAPLADATWDVGREFGTIAARIRGADVEITTYRADQYDGVSRKPAVRFGESLEDDLVRRDFTVNAMALRVTPARGETGGADAVPQLVDVGGGLEHLLAQVIDTPQAPERSFDDDPLRMMRAARFSAQLGFEVAPRVRAAMAELADRILDISAERVRDELSKLLLTSRPVPGIRLLTDTGILDRVLPEVPALRLEADEHAHHKDVYEHSLTVLQQGIDLEATRNPDAAPDLVSRLAGLLHDIGKPATRRIEGRTVTFHQHDLVGARLAKQRLKALRFDNDTVKAVARLVELHLRFYGYGDQAWSDSAVRRYVRDAGPLLERLHILTRSDVTTRNRRKAERLDFAYDDLERRIAELAEQEELEAVRPDLDGNRIQEVLGIPPGREVGEAYRMLLEQRLEHGPLGEERAEQVLRDWWAARDA
ncbi:CCA tRNA nucleotidyltransferase [Agrococcus sp. Marseille-Q4369]|uniref:CCA tRNA nucleotidyltransferase n=1 Tax=Agrococcus sp. Marseille-Q4369 TaxID=2810513 RepID=UPI001B8D5AD9|nr:CCA tRNA nucleotidyltransferase [Agrococcus sp. Marseille-Q4369]QUW20157.1 CCA tRNA nucleotidyltransferase [Agrococcus sp. Marseille-Q4369]